MTFNTISLFTSESEKKIQETRGRKIKTLNKGGDEQEVEKE